MAEEGATCLTLKTLKPLMQGIYLCFSRKLHYTEESGTFAIILDFSMLEWLYAREHTSLLSGSHAGKPQILESSDAWLRRQASLDMVYLDVHVVQTWHCPKK
jgi:hypothetical protein